MPLSDEEADWANELTSGVRATERRALLEIAEAARSSRPSARLRGLLADVRRWSREVSEGARRWLSTVLPRAYESGASHAAFVLRSPFGWTEPHRETVEALARRAWEDIAGTLQGLDESTRRAIRSLLDDVVRRQVVEGLPGTVASKELAAAIQAETGAMTVRYADGSRRSVGDYADTVARTTTATTRNEGAFAQSKSAGVTYMECFDGADCGLTTHDDPQKANGLVLPIDDAEGYTIAHPRCARSWSPRPDVRTDDDAEEARRYSPDEQATMAADERARASRQLVDGRPAGSLATTGRQPRSPRQARAPRSGPDAS